MDSGTRVILAFILALFIIFATAKLIGEENKAKWFRKRTKYTLFTRRGFLGEAWHFGVPCTKEGFGVAIAMYLVIAIVGYVVIFLI